VQCINFANVRNFLNKPLLIQILFTGIPLPHYWPFMGRPRRSANWCHPVWRAPAFGSTTGLWSIQLAAWSVYWGCHEIWINCSSWT